MNTPAETLEIVKVAGEKKASASWQKLLILSFFAGLMIAFAALASTIASMNLLKTPETYGLGKLVQGFVFSGGLIMVILGGAELFTGNSLMFIALFDRKISLKSLLRNWGIVFLGNLLGALFLAVLVSASGLFSQNSGLLGETLASIANTKTSLDIFSAFFLGILCNILVCLAVWMAFSAKTASGKLLACIFPVTFFVACGFEHSIANLFYIPTGFFAENSFNFLGLLHNLLPVILGNIIGGGIFVAGGYFFSLKSDTISLWKNKKTSPLISISNQPKNSRSATTKTQKPKKNSQKTTKNS